MLSSVGLPGGIQVDIFNNMTSFLYADGGFCTNFSVADWRAVSFRCEIFRRGRLACSRDPSIFADGAMSLRTRSLKNGKVRPKHERRSPVSPLAQKRPTRFGASCPYSQ